MSKFTTARAALDSLHRLDSVDVLGSSPSNWRLIALSRLRLHAMDVRLPALGGQMVAINCGQAFDLCRTGKGEMRSGRSHPGHAVLYPHDADSHWVFEAGGDSITAFLSRELIDQVAAEQGSCTQHPEILPNFLFHDPTIERVLRELLHEMRHGGPGSQAYSDGLALTLAVHLIRHHSNHHSNPDEKHYYAMAPLRLKQVMEFIEAHYIEDISLLDMAKVAQMSVHHFAKSFQASTGYPPHQYLINRRLQEACVLLSDAKLPISSIVYKAGFHNQSHFTQIFSRHVGTTPRKFRLMRSA